VLGLRALWWRRGAPLAVLAAATLAVLAAAIGPLWARTAEESVVRTRLSDAPVSEAGYTVARAANSTESAQPIPPVTAEQAVSTEAALPERIDGYFERPQIMLATVDLSVVHGRQRQRVAVARALVDRPELLLADEPTAELDAANRDRIVVQLRAEAHRGAAVVLATHDPEVATRCDAEIHLVDGVVGNQD
jgi:ATPase subunit of ABC transporter with duplicated ATPase domains